MSIWGKWKCPKCGKEWFGGIGWTMPENLDEWLEKICGCTEKEITAEEMGAAIVISCAKVLNPGNAVSETANEDVNKDASSGS